MQDKKIYLNIVLTVVVSYILIKVIDNYKYFFGVISLLMSLLTPFIIAFVLAYIFNPLVKFLESKLNFKRIYSLLLTYGVLIVILISFILFTVPSIVNSLADLVAQIPTYIDKTEQFLFNLGKSLQSVDPNTLKEYGDKIMSVMPKFSNLLIGSLGGIFSTTFSVGKFIVQFLLGFIICFYILLEKEKFLLFTKKVVYISLGKKYGDFIIELCQSLNLNIGKYFTGKILDSFIVGVLSGIGLYFLKSEYALLFGTIMGVMNMVPYFGPVIGMAPVVIINLFSNPTTALTALIYLIIIQQVEVTFIEPKIVGGQLGLSPFFTILAVTVGGGFFGIPGMILSAPVMGVIKIYFCEFVNRRHDKIQME
ncbi:membrane protein [Clostridioides difficile]|uniref:AI-2E family transporter n=1 Tax=Clostridioides difficile TaxID=1496 RepID=UPI000D1E568D|nr:AI-2E family transporter [Clostridioides difficile]UWD42254.1 AI-2E family transporter [Clostridioides difficile]UWD45891.1 AI-2E family transporter [Clostridioides difficile]VFF93739.1 membrane protein [Clostridioides difficile]VIF90680.1 membrane protein [Clostridioides difficile]HBE9435519.1 AI-2E family transporter [Clostridioides difficile]